jgi:hypothetical protein
VSSEFPPAVSPNYDPAAADAGATTATPEDTAWGEIIDVTEAPKAARTGKPGKKAKIAKNDAGLSATAIG